MVTTYFGQKLADAFNTLVRQRKCPSGKVMHATQTSAEAHADQLERAYGYKCRVYFHHECKHWHVGAPARERIAHV